MSETRLKRDQKDLDLLTKYFEERNPFDYDGPLCNIANGQEVDKTVNVDNAKEIGLKILRSNNGKSITNVTFRKQNQAITVATKSTVRIDNDFINIDQELLFQRLAITAQKSNMDNRNIFEFELCSFPPALFDHNGFPLESQKASLADFLWNEYNTLSSLIKQVPTDDVHFVLDGGALLHRIPWTRGNTYSAIIKSYVDYVVASYGKPTVVFDGYACTPTTKDITHVRRSSGIIGKNVWFDGDMVIPTRKDVFLRNQTNKQRFILLLTEELSLVGCIVHHSKQDADTLLVSKTLESSASKTTVLVGDDTDLLVLLVHSTTQFDHNLILFAPELKRGANKARKVGDVRYLQTQHSFDVCRRMLFVHAFSGCDTTSKIYELSKKYVLKKVMANVELQGIADTFLDQTDGAAISVAGKRAMFIFYNGPQFNSTHLEKLRFERFQEKMPSSRAFLHSLTLPPNAVATEFHALRVYFQIQQWRLNETLDPTEWGWKVKDKKLCPIYTIKQPAPTDVLKIIHCSYKLDCDSLRCSCRKKWP